MRADWNFRGIMFPGAWGRNGCQWFKSVANEGLDMREICCSLLKGLANGQEYRKDNIQDIDGSNEFCCLDFTEEITCHSIFIFELSQFLKNCQVVVKAYRCSSAKWKLPCLMCFFSCFPMIFFPWSDRWTDFSSSCMLHTYLHTLFVTPERGFSVTNAN